MKTLHTPAPWEAIPSSIDAAIIEAPHSNGKVICWVSTTDDPKRDRDVITHQDRANIRLIAAAPELLSALESLLEDHKRMFPEAHPHSTIKWAECVEVKQAQQVITKVKGKTLK
jgi:inorganic pyrophosphatase